MKSRILVVDQPMIADVLRLCLEHEQYEVETAWSIRRAMFEIEPREFAVALVGRVLDGDRLHLLRLLKRKDPSLEVIIMTGNHSNSVETEAIREGAFDCLYKPFSLEEMLTVIGNALKRRSL
jgi:DNA-binding NtrC family response regulator